METDRNRSEPAPSSRAGRHSRATRTSAPSPTAKRPATTDSGEQEAVAERLGNGEKS